jgi:hypothetical protein
LIDERGPLRAAPQGLRVVNIRPRPARRCGRQRDAQWKQYEAAELGALGRVEICGACPRQKGCFWPEQYGAALEGAAIIYAAQAHLERAANFLVSLRTWTKAERTLTLLDEANFVAHSQEVRITARELQQFAEALRHPSAGQDRSKAARRWLDLTEMLQGASTADLQADGWRTPWITPAWAVAVQRAGVGLHGDCFRFLGYRLAQLAFSPLESRLRDDHGLRFAVRPYLGDCLILSATADLQFTRYRLGIELASPFAEHRFAHPGTRWYNLASPIGSRRYFVRHAPQILDFFATLIVRRAAEGKRLLLVVKKRFAALCLAGLTERLAGMAADLRVIMRGWTEAVFQDRRVVPLITYGMIGTNLFEHFDAVYCLSGFYVNERIVSSCLQGEIRQDLRLPLRIETTGFPRRRRAGMADPAHRYHDVARLAQPALEHQEYFPCLRPRVEINTVRPECWNKDAHADALERWMDDPT